MFNKRLLLFAVLALAALTACAPQPAAADVSCQLKTVDGLAVNFYKFPDQSQQIGMLTNGETVTLVESRGAWRNVRSNEGVTGWIYAESFCGQ